MPRSTIASRYGKVFDKSLELYDPTTAAISATTNGTAIFLDATKVVDYSLVINPATYTGYSAGSAFWTISLAVSTTSGGTYNTVGSVVLDGTATQRIITVSGAMISTITAGGQYIRVTATKTSTPGTLQFGAFLTELD